MKIGICYHWFAHYRKPIIEEISNQFSSDFCFDFVADATSLEPAMKVLDRAEFEELFEGRDNCRFVRVRNRSYAGFIWQSGVISSVLSTRYDVLIFLGEFRILSTWIAVLIARLRGTKVYYWSHGVYGNESWLKLKIRLSFYKLANGMFLYGERSRKLLIEHGFMADTLHLIFNSLDYRNQIDIRDGLSKSQVDAVRHEMFPRTAHDPLLIFVGRITRIKRLDQLLIALAKLNQQLAANLLIVGEGPELANLKELAIELDIQDRVNFSGPCHEEQLLAGYISAADLCVSPGNIGLFAMHSLVYGTPVITHDCLSLQMPEVEAIVDGRTGGFFTMNNIDSLVQALNAWLGRATISSKETSLDCQTVIDMFYNPIYQCEVFRAVFSDKVPDPKPVSLPAKNRTKL